MNHRVCSLFARITIGLALVLVASLGCPPAMSQGTTGASKLDEEGRLMLEEGRRLVDAGRAADALPFYTQTLDMAEVALGTEAPALGLLLHELGTVYRDAGQLERAETSLRRSLAILEASLGPQNPELLPVLADLASLVAGGSNPAESQELYQRVVSLLRQQRPEAHDELVAALGQLALSLDQQQRNDEAEALYRQAIDEASLAPDDAGIELATTLNNLGALYFHEGRTADAEPLFRRAADLRQRLLGPSHWLVAVSLSDLARVIAHTGRDAEALDLATRAAVVLAPYCAGLSAQAHGETRSAQELCRETEALRARLKGELDTNSPGAPAVARKSEPQPQTVEVRDPATLYRAQLLAREDSDTAQADLESLLGRYSDLLKGVPAHLETIDLGSKGIWYRLQFGDFTSRDDARRLCESLLDRGWEDCWVAEADPGSERE